MFKDDILDKYKTTAPFFQGKTIVDLMANQINIQEASNTGFGLGVGEGYTKGYRKGWITSAPINEKVGVEHGVMSATRQFFLGDNFVAVDTKEKKIITAPSQPQLMDKLRKVADPKVNPFTGIVETQANYGGKIGGTEKERLYKHPFMQDKDVMYINLGKFHSTVQTANEKANKITNETTPQTTTLSPPRTRSKSKASKEPVLSMEHNPIKLSVQDLDDLTKDIYIPPQTQPMPKISLTETPPPTPPTTPQKKTSKTQSKTQPKTPTLTKEEQKKIINERIAKGELIEGRKVDKSSKTGLLREPKVIAIEPNKFVNLLNSPTDKLGSKHLPEKIPDMSKNKTQKLLLEYKNKRK